MLFKVISLSSQCRSATAAVGERCRACPNAPYDIVSCLEVFSSNFQFGYLTLNHSVYQYDELG